MKILHVIPSFSQRYGGPIRAARSLTRELVRQGHEVTLVTTNLDGDGVLDVPAGEPVDMDGVEVLHFPVETPRSWYFSRSMWGMLGERIREFDLVHIHSIYLFPTTAAAFAASRAEVPFVVRPAGSLNPTCIDGSYVQDRWRARISRAKKEVYLRTFAGVDLERATAIHFTTRGEMDAAREHGLRPPGFVLPMGVEPSPSAGAPAGGGSLRDRFPQLRGRKLVLFLSRIDPVKGLEHLVSALEALAAVRSDFAFVLAGSGPAGYENGIRRLVAASTIADRTVMLGHVGDDDKWDVLRACDVFVLPSHHENLGLAIVEAMSVGVPVVISDQVNIHDVVAASGAGLVTRVDSAEVAAAIGRFLDDPRMREEAGRRGAELVSTSFAWPAVVQRLTGIYQRLTAGMGV